MSILRDLLKRREFLLGLVIVLGFLIIAIFAPILAPPQNNPQSHAANLAPWMRIVGSTKQVFPQPPSSEARLGTTTGQRDVYYGLVWGTRNALRFGLIVGVCSAIVGVLIGTLSGYLGGWTQYLMMRVTDGFLTFPLIAAVILAGTLKQLVYQKYSNGIDPLLIMTGAAAIKIPPTITFLLSLEFVLILFTWMPYARIMNAMVLQIKSTEYVEAARAMGASPMRVVLRHLIPNSSSPAIVLLSRDIGGVVLIQAALTFIGFGGGSIWGAVLAAGREWVIASQGKPLTYWWVFVPISLAIILFGTGWSLIGDGLNDVLNPRRKTIKT